MSSLDAPPLVERLANTFASRVKTQPPAASVSSWLNLVEVCRAVDDAMMIVENPPAEDRHLHRALFTLAIGTGEWLAWELRQNRAVLPAGWDAAMVEATIFSLRATFDGEHSEMTQERREKILREVFGAEA